MTTPESPATPESSATPEPAGLQVAAAEDEDEQARAELYGLLARLWLSPPDNAVLAEFRLAVRDVPDTGAPLDAPWRALVATLRATDVPHATVEHDALFGGVGKPEVFLYGSYYLSGFLNERPLAQLREDLTAMGLSRDDYTKFSKDYEDKKIFKADPFGVLDQEGVGMLIQWAVKKGRETRSDLEVGICGEHGGEPSSVMFCYRVGMDYVSCSPYRVPIARLAAAQAAIAGEAESRTA